MIYTVPDYYKKFVCLASDCPATCCEGWKIVIDERSLEAYKKAEGGFGNRLKNSVDWQEGTFLQYHGRCAFLNERNLCDIHLEAGREMMCSTCRKYPRHVEVFENEREISLSLSCPAVARLILGQKKPVRFLTCEREEGQEQDEAFDQFLYSALSDCRKLLLEFLQDRREILGLRLLKGLALTHDVQSRIDRNRIFEVEHVIDRYRRGGEALTRKLLESPKCGELRSSLKDGRKLLAVLEKFEVLDELWSLDLDRWKRMLQEEDEKENSLKSREENSFLDGEANVREGLCEKRTGMGRQQQEDGMPKQTSWQRFSRESHAWEEEYEQLLVYFVFTYFCGAVYDGNAYGKMKMAAASTLILRELGYALWLFKGERLEFEDRARLAWRFSRELEHSDLNLGKMEEFVDKWPGTW